MEISSKRPVSRKRLIVEPSKKTARDPRFEVYTGKFNPDLYKNSYSFLDDYQNNEIEMIRQELKTERDPSRREDLKQTLSSMLSRRSTEEQKSKSQKIKREWRKSEADLVKDGKKPFFLKRGEFKKLELVEKYKAISDKEGSLDKILEKRRKKNASREHRRIPAQRRTRTDTE